MMMLVAIDICLNFHVARFKDGQLVTDRRQLALDYLKGYFFVDLLSSAGCCCFRAGCQGRQHVACSAAGGSSLTP
jgi:hypothetical protein